jgi:hypothetical protein
MTSVTEMTKSCDSRPNRSDSIRWDESSYEKSAHPRLLALRLSCRLPILATDLFGEIVPGYDCVAGSCIRAKAQPAAGNPSVVIPSRTWTTSDRDYRD